ncbi:hypothetical protein H8D85_00735 [bacterium]|nr:hypothetical protein [bacterium]
MTYLRRSKEQRKRKAVQGNQPTHSAVAKVAEAVPVDAQKEVETLEEIYDDGVRINLLEETEDLLIELEQKTSDGLVELAEVIDPDTNFNLVRALSTLAGEATLGLDKELIERAVDLTLDSFSHLSGFDPVASVLGVHGGDGRMPNAPLPRLFLDCKEMQKLKNIPSPEDEDYVTKPIAEVQIEANQAQFLDIYAKLWRVFKYFPGVDIKKFLKKIKNRWTRRPVNKAIRWVECNLINPGWMLLTGEAQKCPPGEEADDPNEKDEPYYLSAEDLDGTGMDCVEAAALVMQHLGTHHHDNKNIKMFINAKEHRELHEANKFATLNVSIKHPDKFEKQIDKLNKSTKQVPRYKKRYYDNKDKLVSTGRETIIMKGII